MLPYEVTLEDGTVVNFRDLRAVLDANALAGLLEVVLNTYANTERMGKEVGVNLLDAHRTLQGCAVRFFLGVFEGLATEELQYTDPRNRVAIEVAQSIAEQVKNGDLPTPPFI